MTRLSYIFVCFLLFLSCTSNTILEPPKDLIPKDKMVSIFVDLHIAQAGKNVKNIKEERNVNYFQLVYDRYQIDTVQFKESNDYYASLIDEYHAIFVEVEARLTTLESKYTEERRIEDSIHKLEFDNPKVRTPRESFKELKSKRERIKPGEPLLKRDSLIQ